MSFLSSPDFWIALSQIILINIVLSGDNAVVIAMASRSLPPAQQKKAIIFGSVGAIVLRVILTFFAVYLLTLPYLKLVGAALLFWIGIGLLKGEDEESHLEGHAGLAAAIKTIVLADLVMSLDNVVGVAAAAKGNVPLLVFGLVISIPLIIFGSTLILKLMDRFPIIIVLGAALLGWVAGEMAVSDPAIAGWVADHHFLHTVVPAFGAAAVVALGKWINSRRPPREEAPAAGSQPAVGNR
ncbi:TerC family protein [Variovorax sp. KK3]|uniref:TerC family protein n=1 Tax=Variovorax sp. KK3 TaxID=1855728 RepID=UPI00097C3135|nr:TerC family protein [Variovorax sp. KK3]